ncbi:hypothetical protein KC19_7G162300 [Ceratodon purpureus]|uniref:Uncharacterized protein n=1 Tax=Ceratodon purpureus TaxID=3225 RepID=A0A8T0HBX1_CERPU|nr:hypothetical protein KC19_7G162300 [Ceratodon purpureus]
MAAGEGMNTGTKRKASEALPCIVIRQVKAARPVTAAEGMGVVTSGVDQEISERSEENLMESCDPVSSAAYSGGSERVQLVDGQQFMPLQYCDVKMLLICDEVTEDTEDDDEDFDEDSDSEDFDAIKGVLQEEIPARWRSGEGG